MHSTSKAVSNPSAPALEAEGGGALAGSRRFELKRATDAAHQKVEGIVEAAGMFQDIARYRHYLAATYEVREHLERRLDASGAAQILPGWKQRRIAGLVAADITDLGDVPPPPVHGEQQKLSPAELLGVLYVLEGSSLGARILVKSAAELGLGPTYGARHLHHQAGGPEGWRNFVAAMDNAAEPPSVAAAIETFEMFADAYRRAAEARSAG